MSGQAPTKRFRGILNSTGKGGEQEAAEEGEVCIPLFPNLLHLLAPSLLLEVRGGALIAVPSSCSAVL